MLRLPDLQLLFLRCERILRAFQCRGWWMGLPVLLGCSGSVSSSSHTLSSSRACCSVRQIHSRRLSQTSPGKWISVRNTNTQNREGFFNSTNPYYMHRCTYSCLNNNERSGACAMETTWSVTHPRMHTRNEEKHHSKHILGLIQNNSIPTNLEIGLHCCIDYCYSADNERIGYNTNYHM